MIRLSQEAQLLPLAARNTRHASSGHLLLVLRSVKGFHIRYRPTSKYAPRTQQIVTHTNNGQ